MNSKEKRMLKEYQKLANFIDNEIEIELSKYWTSCPTFKQVFIQTQKDTQKDIDNFTNFIDTLLPKDKKYLSKKISIQVWSFLHECGHINNCDFYEPIFSKRNFINFFASHFGHISIIDKITTNAYFNLKEEKNATLWAIDFAIANENEILSFSNDIVKACE